MSDKRSTPTWLKRLWELGNPRTRQQESKGRAYRTVTYRYFWSLTGVFVYFFLCAYLLGGDGSGSSDNSGILSLIAGAIITASAGAFFAPRLNEAVERLLPSGRRKKEETIKRRPHESRSRSSGSDRRSRSQSSSAQARYDKADS